IRSSTTAGATTTAPATLGAGWRCCNGSTGAAVCWCSASANTTTDTVVLPDARAVLLPADGATGLPTDDTAADGVLLPADGAASLPADDTTADGVLLPDARALLLPAGDLFAGLPAAVDA